MNRRYLRHFDLFGKSGQYALLESRVLVVGAGGLGCSVLYNLAAAGVGNISIVDSDRVSESDLNRQFLYDNASVQRLKVRVAQERLTSFNPDCKIHRYPMRIQDCPHLIEECEIVVDCTDNFETRFYLNELCHSSNKIFISGGVVGYAGYVLIFKSFTLEDSPCYCCFCPEEPKGCSRNLCETGGVIGAAASVVGSIQAMKVLQEILQSDPEKAGRFIFCDIEKNHFRSSLVMKDPFCAVCKLPERVV